MKHIVKPVRPLSNIEYAIDDGAYCTVRVAACNPTKHAKHELLWYMDSTTLHRKWSSLLLI